MQFVRCRPSILWLVCHCSVTFSPNHIKAHFLEWCTLLTENKNKALQSGDGGGQQFGIRGPGGVIGQPGAVGQPVPGADPINALQNLTKQPVPASMTQQGESTCTFDCVL